MWDPKTIWGCRISTWGIGKLFLFGLPAKAILFLFENSYSWEKLFLFGQIEIGLSHFYLAKYQIESRSPPWGCVNMRAGGLEQSAQSSTA